MDFRFSSHQCFKCKHFFLMYDFVYNQHVGVCRMMNDVYPLDDCSDFVWGDE